MAADPALNSALDLQDMIAAADARDRAFLGFPDAPTAFAGRDWVMPAAAAAIGLGVLLLLPSGGRRR